MTFPLLERGGPREGKQSRSVQEVRRLGLVNLWSVHSRSMKAQVCCIQTVVRAVQTMLMGWEAQAGAVNGCSCLQLSLEEEWTRTTEPSSSDRFLTG